MILSLSLLFHLHRCVYERSLIAPTLVTYTVSAVWHGFYPGYYFTFIFFGIVTVAARKVRIDRYTCMSSSFNCDIIIIIVFSQIRRLVRPYFQGSLPLKWGYHVITWALTKLFLDFGAMPVEFMWLHAVLRFWGSVWDNSTPLYIPHTHTLTLSLSLSLSLRFYYYIPVIAVCVVAFLFPSGKSSGQKKSKTEPVTTTKFDSSTSNGEITTDKKTAWDSYSGTQYLNSTTISKLSVYTYAYFHHSTCTSHDMAVLNFARCGQWDVGHSAHAHIDCCTIIIKEIDTPILGDWGVWRARLGSRIEFGTLLFHVAEQYGDLWTAESTGTSLHRHRRQNWFPRWPGQHRTIIHWVMSLLIFNI